MLINSLNRHNNGIKIETSENTKVTKEFQNDGGKSNAKKGDHPRKFETYFKFQTFFNNIQSHQTLAINRAENLKV